MAGVLFEPPFLVIDDGNGQPVPGAIATFFLAGTSTQTTVYADSALTTPLNPVADAGGRFPPIYLTAGTNYKVLVTDANGSALTRYPVDNIITQVVNLNTDVTGTAGEALSALAPVYLSDGSGGKTAGRWYQGDNANAYSSVFPRVGIALAAIASGASGSIRTEGYISGLSGLTVGGNVYIGTVGTLTPTAPINRRLIGQADSTTSMALRPADAGIWNIVTVTDTGTKNDYAPGLTGNTILRCNNPTLLTINGFAAGYDGQNIIIESIGAGQVDLPAQNTGSVAANRLLNFATVGTTSLAAGRGVCHYIYDGNATAAVTRWKLIKHDQGAWISRAFSAGNYTTNGAGGVTVTSGEVAQDGYYLTGNTLDWAIFVAGFTVTAATGTEVRVAIPAGFVCNRRLEALANISDNAVARVGLWDVQSTVAYVRFFADQSAALAWTASATNSNISATLRFEVQ